MTALTTPAQIDAFRLATLRSAVKLEIYGMTRRGRSATVIAKELLGLPRKMPRELVFAALNSAVIEARSAGLAEAREAEKARIDEMALDAEVEGY